MLENKPIKILSNVGGIQSQFKMRYLCLDCDSEVWIRNIRRLNNLYMTRCVDSCKIFKVQSDITIRQIGHHLRRVSLSQHFIGCRKEKWKYECCTAIPPGHRVYRTNKLNAQQWLTTTTTINSRDFEASGKWHGTAKNLRLLAEFQNFVICRQLKLEFLWIPAVVECNRRGQHVWGTMISSWSEQSNHLISSSGLDSTIAASLFNKGVLCFIRLWLIGYLPELIHARKKRIEQRRRLFSYRRIEIWIYEWSSVRLYANRTSLLHSLARFLQELTLAYLTLSLLRCSQLLYWYDDIPIRSCLCWSAWLTKLRLRLSLRDTWV